ncbi:MAG: CBS domain-containing protein [Saprospiraceae bacterium]|nr:CBS domain-containing protein [Saprospiraceae bacterium]MCF8248672.1 CBS domain-containing protein [Saprospiraceae bacterium]MCF8278838.1 CBS domain-containing protein [Bacteroidales bacterium]MCF8310638.1 CBS domain-containing protein [Saprospiraceae bacterium]MCF8439197.1 CBS domain-containing protein [Saprospiraceae bacterium]
MKNFQQKSVEDHQIDRTVTPPSVTNYMVKKVITFKPDTPISEVIDSLLKNRITGAPVLNDLNEVVGLIDDKDCLNVMFGGAYHNSPVPVSDGTVAAYMSNVMKTISINADIFEVANKFLTTPYKRLLVMDDDGKLAGQVSRRDILRAIKDMNARKK